MSGTVPVCTVDETGLHAPTFADCLGYFTAAYLGIYGADVDLSPDTQDGQWIGTLALALSQANDSAAAAYSSYSPATAQGTGLSNAVKINGIARLVPTNSTVDVAIAGTVGLIINGGIVRDSANNLWQLPASVTIPGSGSITVEAICQTEGAIQAAPQTFTIFTPVRGWVSAVSSTAAAPGQPVEPDAKLRIRQAQSTNLPSLSVVDACAGAIEALPGVTRVTFDNNVGSSADGNGVPGHSVAFVVAGGDPVAIAQTILDRKGPGCGTYGTTSETVDDAYGVAHTISFYRPTLVPITTVVNIHNLAGYSSAIGDEIVAAVIAAINGLAQGQGVLYTRLYVPAQLMGPYAAPASPADPFTFELTSVLISRSGPPAAADVAIAFNEQATCDVGHVTLNVS